VSIECGRKEKATGTAFNERDARDGVKSGLDNTILSHRNRRRKRRAGASFEKATGTAFGERGALGGTSATLTGRSYYTESQVVGNPASFEKAMGTAYDERDALGGMTGGLDAVILSYGGRRRNAGLERAGIEPAREGCRVLPTDHRIARALGTSRARLRSARICLEKATGTAFDERDALSGVTTGLDATSLSHGDRRRNAGLERAGVEPAISANRKAPS
jgi:hypothetical protein